MWESNCYHFIYEKSKTGRCGSVPAMVGLRGRPGVLSVGLIQVFLHLVLTTNRPTFPDGEGIDASAVSSDVTSFQYDYIRPTTRLAGETPTPRSLYGDYSLRPTALPAVVTTVAHDLHLGLNTGSAHRIASVSCPCPVFEPDL